MTGSGTAEDPYIISDVDDLQAMENDLTAYYELGGNIDASATTGWNAGAGFLPIGQAANFTGQLDGKGYTITGLFVNRPSTDFIGLFVRISDGAVVKNVALASVDITGRVIVGALMGNMGTLSALVQDCSSSGTVSGSSQVGGLIGDSASDSETIEDCSSSCSVSGTSSNIGGFAGRLGNVTTQRCYATGAVTCSRINQTAYAGGFVGATALGGGVITKCYATGNVSTTVTGATRLAYAGGFAGNIVTADTNNCYARGNAAAVNLDNANFERAAGFVARVSLGSYIVDDCYSTGLVTGGDAGGFCAQNSATISDCFWDTETSGQATSDGGTGKTTAQMKTQSTFIDAGWDFDTPIWTMEAGINDGYPSFISSGGLIPGDFAVKIINWHWVGNDGVEYYVKGVPVT